MSPNIPANVFLRFFIVSSESSPVPVPPPVALLPDSFAPPPLVCEFWREKNDRVEDVVDEADAGGAGAPDPLT